MNNDGEPTSKLPSPAIRMQIFRSRQICQHVRRRLPDETVQVFHSQVHNQIQVMI